MKKFPVGFAAAILAAVLAFLAFHTPQVSADAQSTVSAAPESQIMPPPPNYLYPNGEAFIYAVEWHLFTAGIATVKMESGNQEQHVSAIADSSGFVNTLYRVHDSIHSYFDPRTFCSQRISKHTEEGSRWRESEVHFDYSRHKTVLREKNLKNGESKDEENDIPGCVTDVISGFYYLASLPLQAGDSYVFPVNDGAKTTIARAKVEGREKLKVPAGTFETVRVQVEAISGALVGKGALWVWFSGDAHHTPVQMRAKLGWGTLLFRLQRIEK
jgi:hypothetical protein